MNLPFEKWAVSQAFSPNVHGIFEEAITCYKSGAFRASLLFSYLGLLTQLKEYVLKAEKPENIEQGQWDRIRKNLTNDDDWERAIGNIINRKDDPILNIKSGIKRDLAYWKDRRNDCAHQKDNKIEYFHTEAIWAFIMSKLSQINIEGGTKHLIQRFKDHYNTNRTAPGTSLEPLINEIDHIVETQEIRSFLDKLENELFKNYQIYFYGSADPKTKWYESIIEYGSEQVVHKIIEKIKSNERLLTQFILCNPHRISSFELSPEQIRELWNSKIQYSPYQEEAFAIYVHLLRSHVIPKDQLNEANQRMFDLWDQSGFREYGLTDEKFGTLAANGFLETVHYAVFESTTSNKFKWYNKKADLIGYYIELSPMSDLVVKKICEIFDKSYTPDWLFDNLVHVFKENPGKYQEFLRLVQHLKLDLPARLKTIDQM